MATARDIVTGALEDRKTIGVGATPTPREMVYGMRRLNEMLSGWANDGIDISHVSLAETDTLDVPDDHLATIRLNLARKCSALAGGLDQDSLMAAETGLTALRAIYFTIGKLRSEGLSADLGSPV